MAAGDINDPAVNQTVGLGADSLERRLDNRDCLRSHIGGYPFLQTSSLLLRSSHPANRLRNPQRSVIVREILFFRSILVRISVSLSLPALFRA